MTWFCFCFDFVRSHLRGVVSIESVCLCVRGSGGAGVGVLRLNWMRGWKHFGGRMTGG